MPRDPDELDEEPSQEDIERFSGVTQQCPSCGADLHDDVTLCWKCGHALSSQPTGLPVWVVIAAGLVLIGLILSFLL